MIVKRGFLADEICVSFVLAVMYFLLCASSTSQNHVVSRVCPLCKFYILPLVNHVFNLVCFAFYTSFIYTLVKTKKEY